MTATTPGLVCAHHHLYSALARGMPAPPRTPTNFTEILDQIWWQGGLVERLLLLLDEIDGGLRGCARDGFLLHAALNGAHA